MGVWTGCLVADRIHCPSNWDGEWGRILQISPDGGGLCRRWPSRYRPTGAGTEPVTPRLRLSMYTSKTKGPGTVETRWMIGKEMQKKKIGKETQTGSSCHGVPRL